MGQVKKKKSFQALSTLIHKVFTQTLSHLMTTINLDNRLGKNHHPHFIDKVQKHMSGIKLFI